MSKYFASFIVITLMLITPLAAETKKEILTLCSRHAKAVANDMILDDPEVAEITESVGWLSGYFPYGDFSPIITVVTDYIFLNGKKSYDGYKVFMDYVKPNCNIIEIEKLPYH